MKKNLNINKTIVTVLILNAIQISGILSVIVYNCFHRQGDFNGKINNGEIIVYMLIVIGIINSYFTIKDMKSLNKDSNQCSMLKSTLEELEDLNKTLRAQRHDFMNHLQVVYSLMEMEEYLESREYIEKVFNDIQRVNKALKTSNPAVNALLQAKLLYGEKRGIKTEIIINSSLEGLIVPAWEFCRVLGNIIDNAIYALQSKKDDRVIEIEIFEDLKLYGFRIKNNGPMIPMELIDKILKAGVTTKGDKGEGMGLSIVHDVLKSHGGDINIISDENFTVFEGWIPR